MYSFGVIICEVRILVFIRTILSFLVIGIVLNLILENSDNTVT